MKRVSFLFLALIMAASLFAGGGQSGGGGTVAAGRTRRYTSLPFVTNRTTVSMLIPVGAYANITSYEYNDNTYTKEITDTTGVHFNFITVPSADFATRRNLLLASGDYPEILNGGFNFNDMAYYAGEGIIIPLDEYHYLEYPMISEAFTKFPALNTVLRLDDKKVYALPRLDDAIWSTYSVGRAWIHMPWVRDFHQLKYPTTINELTTCLRWIRDTDVNRNGNMNDEIPLAFASNNVFGSTAWFAKSHMPFVLAQGATGFGLALVNGRVTEQYRANEYRDTLKYMASLYREGLIKQDAYTMSMDELRAISRNPDPILGIFINGFAHDVTGSTDVRWTEQFVLPPMNGPSGRHWATNREPWGICQAMWHVTDKARDPELVIALYDYMATDVMYLNGMNQKGKTWDNPDPGTLGLDGKPAVYKRIIQDLQVPLNTLWYVNNAMILIEGRRFGEQAIGMDAVNRWVTTGDPSVREAALNSPSYLLGALIHWCAQDTHSALPDNMFIPPFVFSDADNKVVGDIKAVLDAYLQQAIAEFVTGVRDINNDAAWNAYLADLDRLGARERAEIYQKYLR